MVEHALEEASRAGFSSALVVTSPAKPALTDFLLGADLKIPVELVEQPEPRGLGDAVRIAAEQLDDEGFGVILPDDVIPGGRHWELLLDAYRATGRPALCLRAVPGAEVARFGIAVAREEGAHLRVTRLVEKPRPGTVGSNLAVLGRYVVTPEVVVALARIAPGALDEVQVTDGFAAVLDEPGVVGIEFRGELYDCGTPAEYERSRRRYRD